MARRQTTPARAPAPPSLSARLAQNGILASAMSVFGRCGFTATRVEDLLEAAGIARRTFYRYFTGKEDVLAAIYEVTTGELVRGIEQAAETSTNPLEALHVGIDRYLDFQLSHPALHRVLVEQSVRSDSPLAPHRKRLRARLVEIMTRVAATRGLAVDRYTHVALIGALEGVSLELLESGAAEVERAKQTLHGLLDRVLGA